MSTGYLAALEAAWDELSKRDPETQARNAGGWIEEGGIVLEVLGRRCAVDRRGRKVTMDGREAGILESIVVLHYLSNASPAVPAGRPVSYRQLPGGNVFYGAFKRRVIDAVGIMFDRDPVAVTGALEAMGARRQGDNKFVITVLPRLPVTMMLWSGDEEVPASASVLFDETAALFLHIEDLAEVGAMVVDALASRIGDQLRPTYRPSSV